MKILTKACGALLLLACISQQAAAQLIREITLSGQQLSTYLSQPAEQFKLPLGNNEDVVFVLQQTHVMAPELEAKFPEIKTYVGYDKLNSSRQITLTTTGTNIRAVIFDKEEIYRFDPISPTVYKYYREEPFTEEACGNSAMYAQDKPSPTVGASIDQAKALWPPAGYGTTHYRIDKVLIPMSGNFAIDQNITTVPDGLAFTANFLNALSAKYSMEIGISFELHPDNEDMIFLDASDPYPDYPTAVDSSFGDENSFLSRNQVICDSMIGNANYNLSILLCRTSVARGSYTAPCGVTNSARVTAFNSMAVVWHEVGHAFTCPHTSALVPSEGFSPYILPLEPTTMAGSGDYFVCTSIEKLAEWALAGNNIACATSEPSGNSAPQITSTVDGKYMPANTPFVLSNTNATDADAGQTLYYTWQSTDGYRAEYPDSSFSSDTEYLIFAPERPSPTGNIRYVPFLENLLNGTDDPYSHLPWVTRDMHVRCLVRDSVGGVNMTFETVHVDGNSGPFIVNTPIAGDVFTELNTTTVSWNVANTTAAPVSAATVDILLSTDGGLTYPITLLAATPNDGSQVVTIPNGSATQNARIMVKGNGIFFNINPADFVIYDNALPPDFAIYAYDTLKRACGATLSYEFIAQDLGGFGSPITFTVTGLPAGVTSNFPQTVDAGDHVFLTLNNIDPAMHGNYPLTLTATGNSVSKDRDLTLVIAGEIQTLNNYAMSAVSTTDGRRYSVPDLTGAIPEYTIEYWMKFDQAAMGVNSSTIHWGAGGNQILRKNADDHIYMRVCDGPHINLISSIDAVVPGRWYHIAGTYKDRKVNLYVDGVHQGQGNYSIEDALPWSDFSVGYFTNQGISGQLEEFRIWNYVRSEDEIRKHMHLNLTPEEVCSGEVILYLQFEQDSSAVYDVTGNYNTVTPVNGPSSAVSDCPTASGVSVMKAVSAAGTVSFDDADADTDIDVTFNVNPAGEVVVSKLYAAPNGTQPTFEAMNPNFWVIRNFGDTTLSYDVDITFTDAAFNLSPTAANYDMQQRTSFKAVGDWEPDVIGSSFATNAVGFSNVSQFGHFSYGLEDDLSVTDLEAANWALYPNPTNGKMTLVFNDPAAKQIVVENTLGQRVLDISTQETSCEINLSDFSAGIYYVRLVQGTETSTKKIVLLGEQ